MVYVFIIKMLKRIGVLIQNKIIHLWIPAIMNHDSPVQSPNVLVQSHVGHDALPLRSPTGYHPMACCREESRYSIRFLIQNPQFKSLFWRSSFPG